jgi:hypothetical protein
MTASAVSCFRYHGLTLLVIGVSRLARTETHSNQPAESLSLPDHLSFNVNPIRNVGRMAVKRGVMLSATRLPTTSIPTPTESLLGSGPVIVYPQSSYNYRYNYNDEAWIAGVVVPILFAIISVAFIVWFVRRRRARAFAARQTNESTGVVNAGGTTGGFRTGFMPTGGALVAGQSMPFTPIGGVVTGSQPMAEMG